MKVLGIFAVAATAELGGTYMIWKWLREGATAYLAIAGLAALAFYAVVQTYQPVGQFGRLYAAYAGIFLIGSLLWGWGFDGAVPDRFDVIGAVLALIGVAVILWGRKMFA